MYEMGILGILRIIWKRKLLILLGTTCSMLLIILLVLLLPKFYQSNAVIALSGIKKVDPEGLAKGLEIPVYRKYSSLFQNLDLFRRFLDQMGSKINWDLDAEFFDAHIQPIYAFDEKKPRIRSTENSILGIKVTALDTSPEKARQKAGLLGEYILTTFLNMQLGDCIESINSKSLSEVVQLKRYIINSEYEIKNLMEKESLIENQLLKIPQIQKKIDREVINVSEKTEKYLSPQQQLVATKISIKDCKINIKSHLRKIKIHQFKLDYIKRITYLFREGRDFLVNRDLMKILVNEKESFFTGEMEETKKLASYIFNELFLKLERRQMISFKFISGPTLPKFHYKPKRKRIVIAGFILVFFVFVFIAFIIEAWQVSIHKKEPEGSLPNGKTDAEEENT